MNAPSDVGMFIYVPIHMSMRRRHQTLESAAARHVIREQLIAENADLYADYYC